MLNMLEVSLRWCVASWVLKPNEWWRRWRFFGRRSKFKLADHIRDFECPANRTRLLKHVLHNVYWSLDIPVAKLRAEDRLHVELKVPLDKLHEAALDEFFDSLYEYTMPDDTEYPEMTFDIRACSLKMLFDYLCGCLGNEDINW